MKKETFLLYISLIFLTCDTNLNRIENVLKNTNPKIQHLIKNAAAHEIQILLTEISVILWVSRVLLKRHIK